MPYDYRQGHAWNGGELYRDSRRTGSRLHAAAGAFLRNHLHQHVRPVFPVCQIRRFAQQNADDLGLPAGQFDLPGRVTEQAPGEFFTANRGRILLKLLELAAFRHAHIDDGNAVDRRFRPAVQQGNRDRTGAALEHHAGRRNDQPLREDGVAGPEYEGRQKNVHGHTQAQP